MNTYAVFLRRLPLEQCSGIIVRSRLIWEEELTCCIVSSGDLPPLSG